MLAVLCSGLFASEEDAEGYVFIDRDPRHFAVVLDYLREGRPEVLGRAVRLAPALRRELRYYHLEEVARGPVRWTFDVLDDDILHEEDDVFRCIYDDFDDEIDYSCQNRIEIFAEIFQFAFKMLQGYALFSIKNKNNLGGFCFQIPEGKLTLHGRYFPNIFRRKLSAVDVVETGASLICLLLEISLSHEGRQTPTPPSLCPSTVLRTDQYAVGPQILNVIYVITTYIILK